MVLGDEAGPLRDSAADVHTGLHPARSPERPADSSVAPLFRWAWDKHGSLRDALERVAEVVGQLPPSAKLLLAELFVLDAVTIATSGVFSRDNRSTWVGLAVVYCLFHFACAFYAVYAQNEYTLAASVILLLVESAFVTIDWRRDFTGRNMSVGWLVGQWAAAGLAIALVAAAYRSMDGFGWKAFRDVGTRADRLRVHQDYRRFTATLSADLFAAVMCGAIAVSVAEWPRGVAPAAIAICIAGPVIGWYPLKKAVRTERRQLVYFLLSAYALGGILFATALGFAIAKVQTGEEYDHLEGEHGRRFPAAVTLMVSCVFALLLRGMLCYLICRCLQSFGTGLLVALDVARRLNRSASAPPLRPGDPACYGSRERSQTRYDYIVPHEARPSPPEPPLPSPPGRIRADATPSTDPIGAAAVSPAVSAAAMPGSHGPRMSSSGPMPPTDSAPSVVGVPLASVPILHAKSVALN